MLVLRGGRRLLLRCLRHSRMMRSTVRGDRRVLRAIADGDKPATRHNLTIRTRTIRRRSSFRTRRDPSCARSSERVQTRTRRSIARRSEKPNRRKTSSFVARSLTPVPGPSDSNRPEMTAGHLLRTTCWRSWGIHRIFHVSGSPMDEGSMSRISRFSFWPRLSPGSTYP